MAGVTPVDGTKPAEQGREQQEAAPPAPPEERESVTEHSAVVGGASIRYRAVASTIVLRADDDKPRASVFTVQYTRTDVGDPSDRPLSFVFNGGPGSSSAWLHMGMVGPRRVEVPDAPSGTPAPYRVVDNAASLLDVSDLVFIDPVSTGFSRAAAGQEPKQFHGFREDVESVADVIRLLTTRAGRWASPKYLVGESYGTTRAAGLALHLQERHGVFLNGVALISAILMFQTARPAPGNDLPYLLSLPTLAATAWFHGRLNDRFGSLEAATAEAEDLAYGDYAAMLFRASRPGGPARRAVVERLMATTGLDRDFLESCDLRVGSDRFFKELLRSQRRTVGRLDTRYTGIDADAAGETPDYDPSSLMLQGPFTGAVNAYVRGELAFESHLPYEVLNGEAVRPWNFGDDGSNRYLEVASHLRTAMSHDRQLRVLLASGYYDLATPFAAAEWTLDHMGLDPTLAGNVRTARYEAGHMMYVHPPSRERLGEDLRDLCRGWPAAD